MHCRTRLVSLFLIGPSACASPLGPDLPEEATFAGLTFRASAEVVDGRSSVQVTVVASNETSETQSVETTGSRSQVLVVLYRGSETPVFDEADTIGGFQGGALELTLGPGESLVVPRKPVIDAREVLGSEFERGRYLVTAKTAFWTYVEEEDHLRLIREAFELRAGVVELR